MKLTWNNHYLECNHHIVIIESKQNEVNLIQDTLNNILTIVANQTINKTNKKHIHHTATFATTTQNRLDGNHEVANEIMNRAKQLSLVNWKADVNALSCTEFLKRIKCSTKRKAIPNQKLDPTNIEEFFNEWNFKWNLSHDSHTPYYQENQESNYWQNCTEKEFKQFIKESPSHKATGRDGIINEFIKYAPDRFLNYLRRFYNALGFSGVLPCSFNENLIVPVHKNKVPIYSKLKYYRPIGLSSHLKKLFEPLIKQHAPLPNIRQPIWFSGQNIYR